MALTSRERVIAAIEHREPDRVPIDFNPVLDFYRNLLDHLGLEIDQDIKASSFFEVIPPPHLLEILGIDMISVKLGSPKKRRKQEPIGNLVLDEWGVGRQLISQPGGGQYLESVYHPLADASIDDLEAYPWPDPYAPGRGEGAEVAAKRLYEDTDLAVVGRFGGTIIEAAIHLLGFENWLMRAAAEPNFAGALLDKITEIQIALDRVGFEAAGKYIQIFKASGDDLGMQTGPLYSPRMFHRLLLPRLRRRWQAARDCLDQINPSVQIMFHSCGGIRPFIPDLIDAGIQILDPLQPRATGMDSAELKRDFGDKLTFHGGVDEQQILPFGSEDDVILEVKQRIRDYAPGGGYILAPSHYIQADTPPPNLVTMCRAAQRYGRYPIDC